MLEVLNKCSQFVIPSQRFSWTGHRFWLVFPSPIVSQTCPVHARGVPVVPRPQPFRLEQAILYRCAFLWILDKQVQTLHCLLFSPVFFYWYFSKNNLYFIQFADLVLFLAGSGSSYNCSSILGKVPVLWTEIIILKLSSLCTVSVHL